MAVDVDDVVVLEDVDDVARPSLLRQIFCNYFSMVFLISFLLKRFLMVVW